MSESRRFLERLEFQVSAPTKTSSGRPTENFTTVFHRRGKVVSGADTEGVQNSQHQATNNYTITIQHDTAAAALDLAKTRVIWHSKLGDITLNLKTNTIVTTGRHPDIVFAATMDKD